MVMVGVFEFCGMRCQPLRRALSELPFKFGVIKYDAIYDIANNDSGLG